jgi:RNA polymerase sigma-70 factor, ECF subfamily
MAMDLPGSGKPRSRAFEDDALHEIDDLRRLSARLARDRADAEDLVQDTYLRAFRGEQRYQPGTNLKAWLRTILRNLASNRRRDAFRSRVQVDQPRLELASLTHAAAQPSPEQDLLAREVDPQIRAALEALPKTLRDAVWLRDVEELSYADIAARLRIPIGTVMSRISRGRRAIHAMLVAAGDRTATGRER